MDENAVSSGVLNCVQMGILERIAFLEHELNWHLKAGTTPHYAPHLYRDIQDGVSFIRQHDKHREVVFASELAKVEALYSQYKQMEVSVDERKPAIQPGRAAG